METNAPDEAGFDADIISESAYAASRPAQRNFLPWHLPRKQYVRHHQWCEQIRRMLDASRPIDGTLKYFGLPGTDLLDLRHFHAEVCERLGINLRFLGFNTAAKPASQAQVDLNISLDEVRRLPRVDQGSDVIGDDFVQVANEKSIAWKRTRELGPYDVINLDLCDGFAAHAPELDITHYAAMSKLLALQARNKNPWLLLLTTRAGKQHVHPEVLERLRGKYQNNLVECPPFKEVSREHFAIEDGTALESAIATNSGLLPVFLCGLCSWLIGIALRQQPPTKVEVKSVIGYRVNLESECEDLISLALLFKPTMQATGDPLGLANQRSTGLDECESSAQALRRVVKRKDVDFILKENENLNSRMIDAMARLLELARYDPGAYRTWATTDLRHREEVAS